MIFHAHSASSGGYTSHILPFTGSDLPAAYLDQFPALKGAPLPEKDQWTLVISGNDRLLLLSIDTGAHQRKLADAFRLFAVKAKTYLGAKPLLHSAILGTHTLHALRGYAMSDYVLGIYKEAHRMATSTDETELWVADATQEALDEALIHADVLKRVMELVDLPAHAKTPKKLGDWAINSAGVVGFECEVLDTEQLNHLGLHAINAVGRGSVNTPVMIVSHYRGNPKSKDTDIALVGKGVTFDTGGVSIKGSENLHYMKCDMAGGAAMLGAMELAARLKLPLNIVMVVPAAENVVDANSFLPGDVIHSYSGKTIEVINTDAEGRLVLADALAWTIKNEKPKYIIDMATLTGSALRALGKEAAALYCDHDTLRNTLVQAGYRTGEKLWPMPLWDDYDSYLHSDIADVANLPASPAAGSIAAAKFLQVFTDSHPAWAHIDMPGQSFIDSPFAKMKSASGFGVELVIETLRELTIN